MKLNNKNIILCITGGIAAYKVISLASLLKKQGANVYPVLTRNALKFVTKLSLKTITKNKVAVKMFDDSDFIPHISLADLADIIVVAPATANIIAKAACGIADDLVSTLLVSAKCQKIIVPAMNENMYLNPATQKNLEILKSFGYIVMTPEIGSLACGIEGIGRFPDIEAIYGRILENINSNEKAFYKNKKVLITVGGTIEDIDPVRYISNRSSGRMGFAIAEELIIRGAKVTLICANTSELLLDNFQKRFSNAKIIFVRSAADMKDAVLSNADNFDIYIMAGAVSDYTVDKSSKKIKKQSAQLSLNLNKTDDILQKLPKRKEAFYIGFAAESENLIENAKQKLLTKKLDLIIANQITGKKGAIGNSKAEIILLNKWNDTENKFEYDDKAKIAEKLIEKIEEVIKANLK